MNYKIIPKNKKFYQRLHGIRWDYMGSGGITWDDMGLGGITWD